MRKPFVAGNWKMNTDSTSAVALTEGIAAGSDGIAGKKIDVAFFPPFVYLQLVFGVLNNTRIAIGAQDLYFEQQGAFTGEISSEMLKDVGCNFVLCGHSERRHVIGETDELINKKLTAAINGGLLPILCVGEKIEQRENNETEKVVTEQIKKGLQGLSEEKAQAVTIAYEPVWAIGTGRNATPDQAQEVHALIRQLVSKIYSVDTAEQMRIQYGGSVKPSNAAELMSQPDIDGALVGGASLKVDDFLEIIKAAV
jgi:triosephosphate isomerase